MKKNIVRDKSFAFALRIIKLCRGSITRLLHTLEPFFGNVAVQHGIEGSVVEGTA